MALLLPCDAIDSTARSMVPVIEASKRHPVDSEQGCDIVPGLLDGQDIRPWAFNVGLD